MKRRRRRAMGVVLAGLALLSTGCGETTADSGAESEDSWRQVSRAPLSAREWPVAVTVDDRIWVMGGSDAPPCPPNADCAIPPSPLRDGAIYDPATDEWTSMATAPIPFHSLSENATAVVGTTVYVLVQRILPSQESFETSFLSYDLRADRWVTLTAPDDGSQLRRSLVATGEHVVAYPGSHEGMIAALDPLPADLLYDPASDSWLELPPDPLGPSYDRLVVGSVAGPVLFAYDLVPDPGVDPPRTRAAVLQIAARPQASRWTMLPDGEIASTLGFRNVGGLLVNAQEGAVDGGQTNNWGRPYPYGGVLDPSTGTWSELPEREERSRRDGFAVPVDVGGSRTAVSGAWVLDVPTRTWSRVPSGAEDVDGAAARLPTSGQAVAFAETDDGGVLFMWGGAYWSEDQGGVSVGGELLADGWIWAVPHPR